jgi:diaminopimelate dehydrogenase
MINFAISSLGAVGEAIVEVYKNLFENNPHHSLNLVGIIRRKESINPGNPYYEGFPVVADVNDLVVKPEYIICAEPSHLVHEAAEKYSDMGFHTIDSYDNHDQLIARREKLDSIAKRNKTGILTARGWDPGIDSDIRMIFAAISPFGEIFTTFGPGTSRGHGTTVRGIIKEMFPDLNPKAVSWTLPTEEKNGTQKREVYIQAGAKLSDPEAQEKIREEILKHHYFSKDESSINFVDDILKYDSLEHGGIITNKGYKMELEFRLHGDNPVMTAGALLSGIYGLYNQVTQRRYGAYVSPMIAPIDYLPETLDARIALSYRGSKARV